MTLSFKHARTAPRPDSADPTQVQPSDWNSEHVLTSASGVILGRVSAGVGNVEELSPAQLKTLLAYAASDFGLGNVENKSSATIRGEITSGNITGPLGYTPTSVTGLTGTQSTAAFKTGLGLTSADVGLGSAENKSSATIRGELTSGNVTTALGYTPSSVTGLTGTQSVAAFKTGLSLVSSDVGLGNVNNTTDANKPISTAQQAGLDLKANLASPTLTGAIIVAGGTVTVSTPALTVSQTWNTGGTTFVGVNYNMTDTASAAASAIVDYQVNNFSRFKVLKSGLGIINLNSVVPNAPINANTFQINGADGGTAQVEIDSYAATGVFYTRRAQGTCAAPTALLNALTVGTFGVLGYDGAAFTSSPAGSIKFVTNQDWTTSAHGVDVQINATPAGAIAVGEAGRIKFFGSTTANAALTMGGITSAAAALKRNGTGFDVRIGDDSGYSTLRGKLATDTAYTAGAIVPTGYLTFYDSSGRACQVACT